MSNARQHDKHDLQQTPDKRRQATIATIVILALLVADQALKCWVKLTFTLGETVEILPWFQLCFVENNGMAFGIEWFDKLFLTLFRIVAVGLLFWYIARLIRQHVSIGYLVIISLLTAGAIGNIIDCMFYGLVFSNSTPWETATIVPWGTGYAPMLYGRVVDMFYFPIIHNSAGEVIFFQPVFNLADSAITVAVELLIIVPAWRKTLNDSLSRNEKTETEKNTADNTTKN